MSIILSIVLQEEVILYGVDEKSTYGEYRLDNEGGQAALARRLLRFEPGENPPGSVEGDRWGEAVAGGGDCNGDGFADLVAGAPSADEETGVVHLLMGPFRDGIPAAVWTCRGPQPGARFGASLSWAGDFNGDGFDDLAIGAPGDFEGSGSLFLFLGSADGIEPYAALEVEGDGTGASFGSSVAAAGDLNGDGLADFVVGAPGYRGAYDRVGAADVFYGGGYGVPEISKDTSVLASDDDLYAGEYSLSKGDSYPGFESMTRRIVGAQANERLGESVAGAGDVNGDGFDDLIVGSPGADLDAGRVTVFFGSASGAGESGSIVLRGGTASAQFGSVVAGVGDLDGDGFADVAVGIPLLDRVHIHPGAPEGPSGSNVRHLIGTDAGDRFGAALAGGDLNLDGYSDLLVGAPVAGALYLHLGGGDGPPAWSAHGGDGDELGAALTTAGDLDGDGRPDWAAGAPGMNAGEGEVFVFSLFESAAVADREESVTPSEDATERIIVRDRQARFCSLATGAGPVVGTPGLAWFAILMIALAARMRR